METRELADEACAAVADLIASRSRTVAALEKLAYETPTAAGVVRREAARLAAYVAEETGSALEFDCVVRDMAELRGLVDLVAEELPGGL